MKKLKYLLMACCAACVWLAACSDDDYEPLPDWWWEQTGEPAVYPEPNPSITRSWRTAAVMPRPDFRRTPSPG
ncbi:MAG: hypothetical protein ACLRMJ_03080 [Alistipes finegoldii]